MNKIKKTFLKEKENDYKLRNPKIFSKYVIVLSKNNGMLFSTPILFINEFFNQIFTFLLMLFFYGYFRNKGLNNKSED